MITRLDQKGESDAWNMHGPTSLAQQDSHVMLPHIKTVEKKASNSNCPSTSGIRIKRKIRKKKKGRIYRRSS
jgi:hypothetical protein